MNFVYAYLLCGLLLAGLVQIEIHETVGDDHDPALHLFLLLCVVIGWLPMLIIVAVMNEDEL